MTDKEIVSQIRDIRHKNNTNWMALLEIAMAHAPVETKVVLRAITENDRAISDLIAKLAQ